MVVLALALGLAGVGLSDPKVVPPPAVATRPAVATHPPAATLPAEVQEQLDALLHDYFTAASAKDRSRLAAQIERTPGVTWSAVAAHLPELQLWSPQDPGVQRLTVPAPAEAGRRAQPLGLRVLVPADYGTQRTWPLVVVFMAEQGSDEVLIGQARDLLGDKAGEFIVAWPNDISGVLLGGPAERAGDLPVLLAALNHRYRIDTERVYSVGVGLGGHAALVAGIFHTDRFAGIIAIDGTLTRPADPEITDILLPNLRQLPGVVLCTPDTADSATSGQLDLPADFLAAANAQLAASAARLGVPLRVLERPTPSPGVALVSTAPVAEVLTQRRAQHVLEVEHWFRFPAQGRCGWVQQTVFEGVPWTAQLLVVAPAPGETYSQAVTALLRERLAGLSGRIEGQIVRIESARCDEIDVRLNADLLDLERDVVIYWNGKKRFAGPAPARVTTLLENAWADWDFQRLRPVRFSIPDKARALPH